MKKKTNSLLLLFAFLAFDSSAQDNTLSVSVAGGAVGSAFLNNTKLPGYTLHLWGEKKMGDYEDRNYWLVVEHSVIPGSRMV